MSKYKRILELSRHKELSDIDIYNLSGSDEPDNALKILEDIRIYMNVPEDINSFLAVYDD